MAFCIYIIMYRYSAHAWYIHAVTMVKTVCSNAGIYKCANRL